MVFSIAKRWPLQFAMGFGAVKTVAADALVQRYMEGKRELDKRRLAVFFSFGLFQVGFVQYQLYVNAFSTAFPGVAKFAAAPLAAKLRDAQGMRNLAKQVFLDQFVYHPLCYFPVFYCCKEVIQGDATTPQDIASRAMANYLPNALDDLTALWKIFLPGCGAVFVDADALACAMGGFCWLLLVRDPQLDARRRGEFSR